MVTFSPARRIANLALVLAALALAALGVAVVASPAEAPAAQGKSRAQGGGAKIGLGQNRSLGGRCAALKLARKKARRARKARVFRRVSRRLNNCRKGKAQRAISAPPGPTGPLYWGAWIGSQLTGTESPWDMNAVAKFESIAGKPASVINFSSPFADCSRAPCDYYEFPEGPMESIREHGAIPFFSWASQSTPAKLSQPDFQLSDVLSGSHDAYIREWAEAARDWGRPFFLRFNWEMNGNWFAWSEGVNGNGAGEYVAAWRHVHDIFTAVGATNATWVWCPNVDPYDRLQDLAALYPGDAYVDWTGLDGYNWGTNPASPQGWMSFDELFRSTYDEIAGSIAPSKPMIVSEVGSTEYGGSKAAWIADALETARTEYAQLRGLLWFEKYDDGMDWPIETSGSAAAAFAAGIQSGSYLGNSFASIGPGTIQPVG